MLFVLEGNECCYKSTIANKLALKFEYPVVKGSSFELATKGNDALYKHFYNLSLASRGIFDRYIWSNRTYASLFKDYAIITPEQQQKLEDNIRRKTKVFYLYAELDEIKKRLAERGDEYVNEDQLESISEKYEEVLSFSSLDIIRIDTTNKTSNQVFDEIMEHITA